MSHGYSNGDIVTIAGVLGNTAANGVFRVTNKTDDTFELYTVSSTAVAGTGDYVSGGVAVVLELDAVSAFAWVPNTRTTIRKVNTVSTAVIYTKTLGTDFFASGTWGSLTSRLDVLRHNNGDLWVLARDTNASNMRAILGCFVESGTSWTMKWQLDLTTDPDVLWTETDDEDHWRGWVLNGSDNGWSH